MTEPQKYKIFINEVEVILKASSDVSLKDAEEPGSVIIKYTGIKKHLLDYINVLEKSLKPEKFIIHHEDYLLLKKDFKSHFMEIEAGGGLVKNEKNEYLFIYRRGSWDLPKGKIETYETKKQATLREIEEETGIGKMEIIHKLGVTRHTYRSNVGKRIIKKSHWYLIETVKQKLKPQVTEDIEKAQWMTLDTFFGKKRRVYPNILDVIHTQMEEKNRGQIKVKIK
ncbi:MAG: NUDIX domain-containing protein [Saprospiraceae bacterium]|nr:NUDIX domain-containing protein [Saprospiraceae bacterium]MBK6566744.1 NUDIX domain-containing protein [Saprospiraceae bacterium]MBK7522919.1 NUDIX domain-containing protein [Saprospiraceae bacterium]MBK8081771.1 NUDIX domain-containing protein [Saprospiraceae bacterium]MBK8370702.1 NUDIX domain-containing protein [Saprospiraceae bacterium]